MTARSQRPALPEGAGAGRPAKACLGAEVKGAPQAATEDLEAPLALVARAAAVI